MSGMEFGALLERLRLSVSGDSAWKHMNEIYSRDRWSSFDKYRESAEYCADALLSMGLSDAQAVPFPADGRTKFGDWMMPMSWNVHEATLEITDPSLEDDRRILAQWSECPNSLVMWSAPTPPEGATAELVALKEGTGKELESLDISGKIVFTPGHPTGIKAVVSRRGGIGIVSDWLRAKNKQDVVQWINTWSDSPGGWAVHESDSRIWGFSISRRKGAFLRELASEGRVGLKAKVSTELYKGELCYATGSIRGRTQPEEEVILTAHINEQGANDNASGAAALLESARMLRKLISSGKLPAPRRSIRFLMMPESYGVMAFAIQNIKKLRRALAAINVDGGAGDYGSDDSRLTVYANPLCCRSFVDVIVASIVRNFYEIRGRHDKWAVQKYTLAGDNFLCEPLIGVPHTWLEMGDGGDYWHNSADTPDKVDQNSLKDLSVVTAACAYFLALPERDDLKLLADRMMGNFSDEVRQILQIPAGQIRSDDGKRPKRNMIGALTLDGVSPAEWKVVKGSPRWWNSYLAAWWWADGNYTVPQIAQLLEAEFGKAPDDLMDFFEFLMDLGYLSW